MTEFLDQPNPRESTDQFVMIKEEVTLTNGEEVILYRIKGDDTGIYVNRSDVNSGVISEKELLQAISQVWLNKQHGMIPKRSTVRDIFVPGSNI